MRHPESVLWSSVTGFSVDFFWQSQLISLRRPTEKFCSENQCSCDGGKRAIDFWWSHSKNIFTQSKTKLSSSPTFRNTPRAAFLSHLFFFAKSNSWKWKSISRAKWISRSIFPTIKRKRASWLALESDFSCSSFKCGAEKIASENQKSEKISIFLIQRNPMKLMHRAKEVSRFG